MSSCANSPDFPFAADAGIQAPIVPEQDPYRALDELMVVVEALCAQWPERETFVDSGQMRL
ncbi:MAG TPA: hypothetical protein VFN29_12995 [Chiayiivirga sp.]|nr:hypothetical protein [Chiayiivirga sp.]